MESRTETTAVFEQLESEVRSYCRHWPAVFDHASGAWLTDESGRRYLDFFAGAAALNYGHNNPVLKAALVDYLTSDRIVHSLDMYTSAKREFLRTFDELILRPRGLRYRVQFPGPGGTTAVEAALKLARKVTGRTDVICFTGGFHGMTVGSMAVAGNSARRHAAGLPLSHSIPMPFDVPTGDVHSPDFSHLDDVLADRGAADRPAAMIVETVQGEGGINVGSVRWLQGLAQRCRQHDIVLIVDDVQMGCGRTGPFFSFEVAQIKPDIVCLSKAISGYGLPMALTLIAEELDVWEPGEHNGTFRGFNPALVTGTVALRTYWQDEQLSRATTARGDRVRATLSALTQSRVGSAARVRGRGLAVGVELEPGELAKQVAAAAFARGLLVETAGPHDEVVKLLPPLTISDQELDQGLAILADALEAVC